MAEEKEPKEEPKEEPKTEPKEEPKNEPKEERRETSSREEVPPTVKCPECRTRVDVDELGSHRYLAHKVERRDTGKRKDDGEDGDKDTGDTPRTPKRKTGSQGDESGAKSGTQSSKGRWGKVRSGWG